MYFSFEFHRATCFDTQKRLLSIVYVLQVGELNESCSSVCLNEALVVVLSR